MEKLVILRKINSLNNKNCVEFGINTKIANKSLSFIAKCRKKAILIYGNGQSLRSVFTNHGLIFRFKTFSENMEKATELIKLVESTTRGGARKNAGAPFKQPRYRHQINVPDAVWKELKLKYTTAEINVKINAFILSL
jgi:hypothetical protein